MTTTPKPETKKSLCCGQGGSWAPKPGEALVQGCQLCPKSATYWRDKNKP